MDSLASAVVMDGRRSAGLLAVAILLSSCDRNIAPFDPDEQPAVPDLSRIFPEGAKERPEPRLPAAPGSAVQSAVGEPVRGRVRVAPELLDRIPPGAVLFIIARRAATGPPLAVKRVRDPRLPLEFTLGPENRMIQSMPFEGPLRLSARLDADGNAMSRDPGDLLGEAAGPVQTGARGVEIVIDQSL